MASVTTITLVSCLLVAFFGWLATVHAIRTNTRLSDKLKRRLIVPSWFPWMVVALGAVVAQGRMSLDEAFQGGMSFSVGMLFFLISSQRQVRRSRNME